ncbi:MAG: TadE/TadG family type IV pilus assembly protein, partial [Acidimicrobiales bacterium]
MTRRAQTLGERGSVTVELAILTPLFAMLLAFVVLAGRVQSGRADVEAAARAAARTISLSRDTASAVDVARQDAESMLRVGSPTCTSMGFNPIVSGVEVTVEVSCVLDLAAASMLPVGPSFTVTGSATEII